MKKLQNLTKSKSLEDLNQDLKHFKNQHDLLITTDWNKTDQFHLFDSNISSTKAKKELKNIASPIFSYSNN